MQKMQDSKKSTEIRNGFELIYMLNNQIIVLIKFTKNKLNYLIFLFYFREQTASLLAAGGSLLSVILVMLFIPHIPKQKPKEKAEEKKSESILSPNKIFGLIFAPGVTMLLVIKLVCGVPIGIIQSMFSGQNN